MAGLFAQFIEDFKKGRDEAYAARGFRESDQPAPQNDAAATAETRTEGGGESGDNTPLVTQLAEKIKTLQTNNEELEGERDKARELLTEVAAEAKTHKERIGGLETELAEKTKQAKKLESELRSKKKLIDKLTAPLEALQARIAELEGERETLAAPYRIRGMKRVMLLVVHEDAHKQKNLTEEQRHELTEGAQAVNAAFALVKRLISKTEDSDE